MVPRPLAALPPRLPAAMAALEPSDLTDELEWVGVQVTGDFSGRGAQHCEISESRVVGGRFVGTDLDRIRVRDTLFESCDLTGARLAEAALIRVEFRNCKMSAIDLAAARLSDVLFSEAKLDNANFRMITGDHVQFDRSNLQASDFYGAAVTHAQFLDCNLTGVEFSQSELDRVHLHGSTLEGLRGAAHLHSAIIDSTQVLPLALGVFGALGIEINDDRDAR